MKDDILPIWNIIKKSRRVVIIIEGDVEPSTRTSGLSEAGGLAPVAESRPTVENGLHASGSGSETAAKTKKVRVALVIIGGVTVDSIRLAKPLDDCLTIRNKNGTRKRGTPKIPLPVQTVELKEEARVSGRTSELSGKNSASGGAATGRHADPKPVHVNKGEFLGNFARGGSAIALFFGSRCGARFSLCHSVRERWETAREEFSITVGKTGNKGAQYKQQQRYAGLPFKVECGEGLAEVH